MGIDIIYIYGANITWQVTKQYRQYNLFLYSKKSICKGCCFVHVHKNLKLMNSSYCWTMEWGHQTIYFWFGENIHINS